MEGGGTYQKPIGAVYNALFHGISGCRITHIQPVLFFTVFFIRPFRFPFQSFADFVLTPSIQPDIAAALDGGAKRFE